MTRALVLAALLLLATDPAGAADDKPLAAGAAAPDTALVELAARRGRLADLLKQRDFVVLAFYVKAFTGG